MNPFIKREVTGETILNRKISTLQVHRGINLILFFTALPASVVIFPVAPLAALLLFGISLGLVVRNKSKLDYAVSELQLYRERKKEKSDDREQELRTVSQIQSGNGNTEGYGLVNRGSYSVNSFTLR
jgi:hypothetical protein